MYHFKTFKDLRLNSTQTIYRKDLTRNNFESTTTTRKFYEFIRPFVSCDYGNEKGDIFTIGLSVVKRQLESSSVISTNIKVNENVKHRHS